MRETHQLSQKLPYSQYCPKEQEHSAFTQVALHEIPAHTSAFIIHELDPARGLARSPARSQRPSVRAASLLRILVVSAPGSSVCRRSFMLSSAYAGLQWPLGRTCWSTARGGGEVAAIAPSTAWPCAGALAQLGMRAHVPARGGHLDDRIEATLHHEVCAC